MKAIRKLASAAMLVAASAAAVAQYPSRPIHMIVPFAAGGPTDAVARALGRAMSRSMGQPVIVENRPGAEGQIAAQAVHGAAPDGYTLFMSNSSTTAGLAALKRNLPFNPLDFTPIARVASLTFALYVSPEVPAATVAELVRVASANPGKLHYAVSAHSEFMAASQFMKATGIDMVKVPYKGSAQAIPELLAGRVQLYFAPLSSERIAYAKDGRLRMLATLSSRRSSAAPDVQTMAELGFPLVSVPTWQAIVGPPGMQPEIVRRIAGEAATALQDPELRTLLASLVIEADPSGPEELAARIRSDYELWMRFIQEHGIPRG